VPELAGAEIPAPAGEPRGGSPAAENLIDGVWGPAASGATFERRNPANPDEVLGPFPDSGPRDVEDAAVAAEAASADWARRPAAERAPILLTGAALAQERAEAIAHVITRETGKPLREARGEAARVATTLRYFAADPALPLGEIYAQSLTDGHVSTRRRPLGVVGLITPWNFPVAIPAWKAAPALVAGNAVVLKPSEDAPMSAMHFARCLTDAGLPPGVLNVVIGRGPAPGAALVERPEVRAVSFTGSTAVGRAVRDAATVRGKPVQLEMGGQNPLVVMADADLDRAVGAAYAGAFMAAGQKCTATRRIFVQDAIYDDFRERLLARMRDASVGDPTDPGTEIGPLINERQYHTVLAAIEPARTEGGRQLAGGEIGGRPGWFVAPTLFEGVDDRAPLAQEETFGSVTTLFRFTTLDDAIARANVVEHGLSAASFTSSLAAARRFADEAQAGVIHINSATTGAEVYVPFGGVKASGWGPHEQGRAALEFYTQSVTVYEDA
jgi:aldehyde dehydrogenase (NAD+)